MFFFLQKCAKAYREQTSIDSVELDRFGTETASLYTEPTGSIPNQSPILFEGWISTLDGQLSQLGQVWV